ncbi:MULTISPECIES: hypothetical protein [unclassified Nostoc]|uniref:hypothetical protein n=1 Tax=unclassified Nostoc TaxID=2593658 RepID=UPI002AD3CD13|nr:hypothetical protein [Nostoc sp. DedQUE03]MDZ7971272.1 hypothetical protein [Nostoc sp. DedQUE03]MDZ8045464.1 hypothetical protein [Nostoc sp. DedQUE02]
MTKIADLTFQQLETESGLTDLFVIHATYGLMLRLSALTPTSVNSKSAAGVVQALYQLRELAAKAQITVNLNQTIGERLAAFPTASTGTAVNGYVMSSGQIITKTPLSATGIIGVNN